MSSTRRARAKVSLTVTGELYLLHFHQRLGTGKHSIQHYVGFTPDLEARLDKHRRGQGARITQVLKERGIGWDVVAVWPGNRQVENALKLHSATRICPVCTPSPRIPLIVQQVIEAEEQRRAREAKRLVAPVARAARARSPYQRGAELAELFLRDQVAAGRTARQIAATHAYLTGPGRRRGYPTPTQAEVFRGYSDMVTAALAQLRQGPAANREPAARTRLQAREAGRSTAGPRWSRRRAAEREDGLPQNADGSLSRSRTTDAQKLAAGVMTGGQQAEHTALRRGVYGRTAPELRGRIQRLTAAEVFRLPDPWAVPARGARAGRQRELEPEAGWPQPALTEREERMQEQEPGTWLARDGDGRMLEVDAADYPAAVATPGDGRQVAEAVGPGPRPPRDAGLLMGPPRAGKCGSLAREREAEAG